MTKTNFVWIDVSKKDIHIYDPRIKKYSKIKNNVSSIKKHFKSYGLDSVIVYEPTWIYSKTVEKAINDLNLRHKQIHASKLKDIAKWLWFKNKTDKLDCEMISEICEHIEFREEKTWKSIFTSPSSNLTNQSSHYLSQIAFYKKQIKFIKQENEKLENSPYDSVDAKKTNKNILKKYGKIISELEKKVEAIYENEEEFSWKIEKLQTIPWVWTTVSINMLAYFWKLKEKWLKKKDIKKVISYAWLNPVQCQSWDKEISYLSKKWDIRIRNAIYMTWIQFYKQIKNEKLANTILWKFFTRMQNKFASKSNKRWKSVACATIKKILTIAWAMFRDNTEYKYI